MMKPDCICIFRSNGHTHPYPMWHICYHHVYHMSDMTGYSTHTSRVCLVVVCQACSGILLASWFTAPAQNWHASCNGLETAASHGVPQKKLVQLNATILSWASGMAGTLDTEGKDYLQSALTRHYKLGGFVGRLCICWDVYLSTWVAMNIQPLLW